MGDRKKHKTPIIPNDNAVNPKVLYLFFAEYLKHQTANKISATIDVIIAKNGIESVSGLLSSSAPIESAIIKNRKIKLMIEDATKTKYLIQFFTKSPPIIIFFYIIQQSDRNFKCIQKTDEIISIISRSFSTSVLKSGSL